MSNRRIPFGSLDPQGLRLAQNKGAEYENMYMVREMAPKDMETELYQ